MLYTNVFDTLNVAFQMTHYFKFVFATCACFASLCLHFGYFSYTYANLGSTWLPTISRVIFRINCKTNFACFTGSNLPWNNVDYELIWIDDHAVLKRFWKSTCNSKPCNSVHSSASDLKKDNIYPPWNLLWGAFSTFTRAFLLPIYVKNWINRS